MKCLFSYDKFNATFSLEYLVYDAVSVSKLFILSIAEFEFSHGWII